MECLSTKKLPTGGQWTYEIKLDGFRVEAVRDEDRVILYSKQGKLLTFWSQEFPNRQPSHFVFPSERYGLHGTKRTFGGTVQVYDHDPEKPIGSIATAWQSAKKRTLRHCPACGDGILIDCEKPRTGYMCMSCHVETDRLPTGLNWLRFHDLRHSAVSRMIAARVPIQSLPRLLDGLPAQWLRWQRDMVTLDWKNCVAQSNR